MALLPVIGGLECAVVMAGDFNMVGRSATMRRLAAAARVTRAGPERGTYLGFAPVWRLPIDHVLAPGGTHRGASLARVRSPRPRGPPVIAGRALGFTT